MNTSHYPSLELCKKLSKIGFSIPSRKFGYSPHSELAWFGTTKGGGHTQLMDCGELPGYKRYVCPSVMEMLDVMPADIQVGSEDEFDTYDLSIFKLDKETFCIRYSLADYIDEYTDEFSGTLPNALAEIILWLHENNYINFK